MIFLGLMVLVVAVAMVFSAFAQSRRRVVEGRETTTLRSGSYGFTAPARGLPTDVPLSQTSRDAIDSDISVFGTEFRELDFDSGDLDLTGAARHHYTVALTTYEKARQALRDARTDSQATHITHLLEEGRYAVACARAGALGRTLPRRLPPCFFNPAHGPSVEYVAWTPPGGVEHHVPACAVDVARIGLGAEPQIRMVGAGPTTVPYWEDQNHAAWAQGYYGAWMNDLGLRPMTQGTTMIRGFSRLMGMLDG